MDDTTLLVAGGAAALLFIMFNSNSNETTTRDDSDPVPDSFASRSSPGGTAGAVNRPTYEAIAGGIR